MRIESPLFALNALEQTQRSLSRALERLSSGRRINTASDDPAGLSISEGLDSEVRGLAQASRNINEGLSFLQTAEGSMASLSEMLQRMKELAVRAATGTLGQNDRSYLNMELQQLYSEFQRIVEQANFNGTKLLDGTFGTENIQVGSTSQETIGFSIGSFQNSAVFPTITVGTGNFQPASTIGSGPASQQGEAAVADVNGDGKPDILAADGGTSLSLYLGNGNGTFQARRALSVGSLPVEVQVGDLNGDGNSDVVSVDKTDGTVSVLLGNGDGTFKARTTYAVGTNPLDVHLADLNGDGKLDLETTDSSDNTVSILMGNGDGTFKARTTLQTGNSPYWVTSSDVNGDGKIDLISSDQNDNTISIFLGNGDGTFKSRTTISVGTLPIGVKAADLNGDGKVDLVVANDTSSNVSILLGNGDGTFKTPSTLSAPTPWNLSVADLNNDGKLDLVTYNTGGTYASIFLGNGNGTFSLQSTVAFGSLNGISAVPADLNKDGVLDLVGLNSTSNLAAVALAITTQKVVPFDILTQSDAANLMPILDSALTYVNSQRSAVGAEQNRLSTALDNTVMTQSNLAAARSQIMDTDVASETSELIKDQILQRADVSVLAQANFTNQLVLKLLNF